MDKESLFSTEPLGENEPNIKDTSTAGDAFEFELPDVPTMTDDSTGEVITPAPRSEDSSDAEAEKKPRRRKKSESDGVTDGDDIPKRKRKKKSDTPDTEDKPKRTRKKNSEPVEAEAVNNPEIIADATEGAELTPESKDGTIGEASADAIPNIEAPSTVDKTSLSTEAEDAVAIEKNGEDNSLLTEDNDENGSLSTEDNDGDSPLAESSKGEGCGDMPTEDNSDDSQSSDNTAPAELIIEELSLFDEPRVVDIIPESMPESPVDEALPEPSPEFVPTREEKYDPENPRRVDYIFDFIELFIFTLVAVLLATTFFVRHSVVEGESMLGTLNDGDTLIISNLFYTAERGDIVVVEDYTTLLDKPIVKRVIGIGGDHIRVREEGIYLNGKLLDEPYVFTDLPGYTYNVYPTDTLVSAMKDNKTFSFQFGVSYEFVVPEGELFVLGDHRNNSTDSRMIGTVRCDAVLGRVLFRILPFDVFGEVE